MYLTPLRIEHRDIFKIFYCILIVLDSALYLKLFLHIFKQDETDSKTASPWKVGVMA